MEQKTVFKIRENITPRGDGNFRIYPNKEQKILLDKREYNSERRRKQSFSFIVLLSFNSIRENITPRGDGNEPSKFKYLL